ncbi:MAG: rhomboid family intramembrane serine protease [Oscillospiraceae bacterium]|nr:rhomboid family intramembrane serine protease [Oscillospiraceae bacterium]
MLYVTLGSALVYIMSLFNGGEFLYQFLCFDKAAILKGQIWRLFTYIFTYSPSNNPFLILISFYFFYNLNRHVELSMGTLRFNLFYFSGVLLMDIFAMIFCPTGDIVIAGYSVPQEYFTYYIYANMALYLHLSTLLMFATTNPDSQFLVFFIIPVKAWFLGIVYLVLTVIEIFNMSYPVSFFPHSLFPLIGLMNYLLFAGKDVRNLFPFIASSPRKSTYKAAPKGTIPFRKNATGSTSSQQGKAYMHRCSVCGKTDVTNPELEFRYCSRCNGYHCYCEDHINNHIHVE